MYVLLKAKENSLQKVWLEDLQVCVPLSEADQIRGQEITSFKFEEVVK